MRLHLALLLLVLVCSRVPAAPPPREKARLFVLTDISSIETGVLEPDDAQSLVRLLLYANDLDLEGLAATSNLEHGQRSRPDLIQKALDAYAHDLPQLRQHDPAYPETSLLRSLVTAGQPVAGKTVPLESSVGAGRETDASRALMVAADRPDARPLWVVCWGGTADLAQALWSVSHSRSPADLEKFIAQLRIHAIGDQDSTAAWIQQSFPTLFYIRREIGYRGLYRGGDTSLVDAAWVRTHVKGHGALGEFYPVYDGGDRWTKTLGRIQGVKEGDTPSYLNLLSGDPLRGWGGTLHETAPHRFTEEAALDAPKTDLHPSMAQVYRFRPAFQADFARRLEWCRP